MTISGQPPSRRQAGKGARSGVTSFGDIGRLGRAGFEALKAVGLRGVLFQETDFSADGRNAVADFEKLHEKFLTLRTEQTDLVEVGFRPCFPLHGQPRTVRTDSSFGRRRKDQDNDPRRRVAGRESTDAFWLRLFKTCI